MELVLNNYPKCRNHLTVINELIDGFSDIKLAVAFVKASGVNRVIDKFKGKKVKILCSLNFFLTENKALSELLKEGYDIRFSNPENGIMHTKIWFFNDKKRKKALVGSANFTLSALTSNLEASILVDVSEDEYLITMIDGYFDYLWQNESFPVNEIVLKQLADIEYKQKELNYRIKKLVPKIQSSEKTKHIKDFIKNWINIDVSIIIPGQRQSKLWRGWYIIPDQGLINDNLMLLLKSILGIVLDNNGILDMQNNSEMNKIYAIAKKMLISPSRMSDWELFVRREKNYLIKFGFVHHPIKDNGKPDENALELTDYGKSIAQLDDTEIDKYKSIYAESMNTYHYNALNVYPFVLALLERFEYIDFFEFNTIVKHIYDFEKLDLAANLISMYRDSSKEEQKDLQNWYKEEFKRVLEPTAKSVQGNYEKSVKHQMSAIGWLPNCVYDEKQKKLRQIGDK